EEAKDYFDLTEAIVAIPLVLNTKLLGMINLGKKANFQRYRASDFYFLNTLKNESVIAILNSLLYENMEEQVKQRSKELIEVQSQLIQAEKLATVGTLAGGVAHEINNPLAAILTNAQMLLDSDTINNESDKESLELIEEATKRCQNIVQKLMFYARKPLESKGVTAIDLLAVVNKVISFIGYQMEQENVTVRIQADDKVYSVMGNHNELEQVVTNILLNAKDAIRHVKKSGEIHISFSKSGQWIELKIKDEGGGISSNIQSKIFDPFFTTKDIGEGLGLGLSICQAIIQRHNGEIKVKSQSGEGAVFIIRLGHAIGKDQSRSQ
ncbi:MAG: ATP-binding protein, partial [Candidatus Omnitrophica bacterium]|nr:ATP-binding protein [Candidatus Omnitrophota bacterium]